MLQKIKKYPTFYKNLKQNKFTQQLLQAVIHYPSGERREIQLQSRLDTEVEIEATTEVEIEEDIKEDIVEEVTEVTGRRQENVSDVEK